MAWAAQPSYDGWAWLLWGREVAGGGLDTAEGPAWKPLPVLLTTPLGWTPFAVEGWLVVARGAALLTVVLAWRIAGWAGALGVALVGGFWWHGLVGNSEGLFCAAGLLAVVVDDRRARIACCVALALLRPEVWPFLLLAIAWTREWRLLALAPLVALAWFVPEQLGSGDWQRSGSRARIPNPGQPATADRPLLASLELGLGLLFLPVLAGLAFVRDRRTLVLAGLGLAWIVQVAVMAELGYSGEGRYALPGVVLLTVAAAAGWQRAPRPALALGAVALLVFLPARIERHERDLRAVADEAELWAALPAAIDAAGGRDAVLACGRPVTGRFRGTGLAYALRVPKRLVTFGAGDPGVHFRSRVRRHVTVQPPSSGRAVLGRSSRWELRYGPAPCESRPSQ